MRLRMLTAAAMVLACVAGTAPVATAQEAPRGRQAFRSEVTDREVRSLSLGADGMLALSNMVGDITVRTGEGLDIRLEIRRVSRGATEADARLGLERALASDVGQVHEARGGPGPAQAPRIPDDHVPGRGDGGQLA